MSRPALWTDRSADAATGGHSTMPWLANGVAFDSRQVVPGDLFVALKGETSDGHGFVGQAFDGGASAAMVNANVTQGGAKPLLLVPDTTAGLDDMARAARARCQGRICAVTGSVGKTGTKEMLRHVLASQGQTHASEKSFNNHVGTPLSLARMPETTRFGVFELGMNAPGEIAPLAQLVRPHVALITTVERVHGATFGGFDAIAAEKADIFTGLADGGVAVINGDGSFVDYLAGRAREAGADKVIRFGVSEGNDVRMIDWRLEAAGTFVSAVIFGQPITYELGVWGRHQAINSLAVLAVVASLGADVAIAADALKTVVPPPGRGQRHHVPFDHGSLLVIDESYNCSPVALRAALDVLQATAVGDGGRRIAVIGDMLELGGDSAAIHEGFAEEILDRNIDLVALVGHDVVHINDALPADRCLIHADHAADIVAPIMDVVRPGDVVMIKGSRRIGLEAVVEALLHRDDSQSLAGNG